MFKSEVVQYEQALCWSQQCWELLMQLLQIVTEFVALRCLNPKSYYGNLSSLNLAQFKCEIVCGFMEMLEHGWNISDDFLLLEADKTHGTPSYSQRRNKNQIFQSFCSEMYIFHDIQFLAMLAA